MMYSLKLSEPNTFVHYNQSLAVFKSEYEERAGRGRYSVIIQAYKLYDVVWVLALALNNTNAMVNGGDINETGCKDFPGALVPLEEFDYPNKRMGCLIQWSIQQTNFSGLTVS